MNMIPKIMIIAVILIVLAGSGAYALFQMNKAPDLATIQANPAAFAFDDYKDKVALHTRLSALFPRGTPEEKIAGFFKVVGHERIDSSAADCIVTLRYNRARFYLSASERQLVAIQVVGDSGLLWPKFTPDCTEPRVNSSAGAKTEPLTPASAPGEQPIYLPLEPIPGVE